ncbi:hypothetical protein QBC38DRAFT_416858 [Podospora fimiseda]|uniref:Uncharacterized protein n=1 Tax=Podospora fimiseda TaxID=252190 RepID=A0AAN7BQ86_9PEZI|nr:hypothetical protein QBC38DRAFT_416858 [Podospora fimiseda]
MRVTAPSLRRRNVARLEMRSRDRWLAPRHGDEEHDDEDGDHMDGEDHENHSDSDSSDSEDEEELLRPVTPPPAAGGVGVITLPPVNNGAQLPGVTLGAEENVDDIDSDSDSDDEEETTTTAPPATITSDPSLSAPGLPETTSGTPPSVSDVSNIIGDLLNSAPTAGPTLSPGDSSLTIPGADGGSVTEPERETLSAAPLQEAKGMDGGAAAGIVVGVLAIIGLMVGAAFFWRKYRASRGLPFFPFAFGRKKDGKDQKWNSANNANPKTNTKIMDDLMKAAYDAENGGNDMAAVYWQEKQQSTWLDPKAFAALGGEPTPRTPKKPVSRWLEAVQTPRDSRGPEGFPIRLSTSPPPRNPNVPQPTNGIRPPMPGTMAGDRVEPPKPVYNARETMTTDTTGSSGRWYG